MGADLQLGRAIITQQLTASQALPSARSTELTLPSTANAEHDHASLEGLTDSREQAVPCIQVRKNRTGT